MESCSICGLFLAPNNNSYPKWCRDVRALCWPEGRPILSDIGHIDDNDYLLPIPTPSRFLFQRALPLDERSCFPFHAACWSILEEVAGKKLSINSIETLFGIFESCHFDRYARALSWQHNYYLKDILESQFSDEKLEGLIMALKDPADHSLFDEVVKSCYQAPSILSPRSASCNRLLSLPAEILHSIMGYLPFRDNMHLLHTCRHFKGGFHFLPSTYWERVYSETGFTRSTRITPWQDWFFSIKSAMRRGPIEMSLRNRKRIWRLSVDLNDLIQSNMVSGRVLHGDCFTIPTQQPQPTVSCLALKYDATGCREIMQRSMHWGESQICAIAPSYVFVSNRRYVSGITFVFSGGASTSIGYIVGRQGSHLNSTVSPKSIYLLCSSLGVETVALDEHPESFFDSSSELAVSKWKLKDLKGVSIGLDAIRIVRIGQEIQQEIQKQFILDNVLWMPPYPLLMPSMHDNDIATLYEIQSKSFSPVSTLYVKPENGYVIAIKVYAPGGYHASITGIRIVYNTGIEQMWGSDDDSASLSFFLDKREYIVCVRVYKTGSLVCHLQFVTNLDRTSDFLPQLPSKSDMSIECIHYQVSDNGYIFGFCGCFKKSSQELHCFGVLPTTTVTISTSTWSPPVICNLLETMPLNLSLRQIKNHGEFQSRILLERRQPRSIQASFNTVKTNYRRVGQLNGLLFYFENSRSHPDLLGQWNGASNTYNLAEDECIMDIRTTTIVPCCKEVSVLCPGLTQVEGITVVTNRRKLQWRLGTLQICDIFDTYQGPHRISQICWYYNAMFDCVRWTYERD